MQLLVLFQIQGSLIQVRSVESLQESASSAAAAQAPE
jgi:hypothetical protein